MGFKGKVLAALIIYFAGFATAIYALAPADPAKSVPASAAKPVNFPQSFTKSDQFARTCADRMHKCAATVKSKFAASDRKS